MTHEQFVANYRSRCDCGRFIKYRGTGVGWYAHGEFGKEIGYVCKSCVARPGFKLRASNGSDDPRWCGVYP